MHWLRQLLLNLIFGNAHDAQCAQLFAELAQCAVDCARHLRDTEGRDLDRIVAFEHEGDGIGRQIHEAIDRAFIMRLSARDAGQLLRHLDDILDGIRMIASHLDIYQTEIPTLCDNAQRLITIIVSMTEDVQTLVAMLSEKRLASADVRTIVERLQAAEGMADGILVAAKKAAIVQHRQGSLGAVAHNVIVKLFHRLERITDSACHCGHAMLTIARGES
ncbi:MAG: DUF47 family protein [Parcubacteria group bacterium]|nr:DUF47 family protein [Parcubacteria group bacterium]